MKLKPSDLAALAADLTRTFTGARVQKAWSVARAVCVLQLKGREGEPSYLLVRSGGAWGRLSLLPERPALLEDPPQFQALLRRHLEGAALTAAEVHGDRLLLHFTRGPAALVLVAVMDGGGALAVVEEGRVGALDAPRGAAPQDLLPGKPFEVPVGQLPPVHPEPVEGSASRLTLHTAENLIGAAERAASAKESIRPLKQKLERTLRTLEKIRGDLGRAAGSADFRRQGELLKHNLHRVTRGQKEIALEDWADDGTRRTERLELDPRKTGPEQVAWFFHQAKRLERGAEVAKERLLKLEAEAKELESTLTLRLAQGEPGFVEPREAPAKDAQSPAQPFREYTAHGGYRVRVGKGPKHNDTLTLKLAKPDDVWLHARGAGGAHVVISMEKGQELPQEALLDAAHLALFHSNLKGEASGEVAYTRARFVRKPKGSAPGAVTVTREKVFWVRVEAERLNRLLSAEV